MNKDQRFNRRQTPQDDPYEQGFAHKLYEEDFGPEPSYGTESYSRREPPHYPNGMPQMPPMATAPTSAPAPKGSGSSFFKKLLCFFLILGLLLGAGYVALQIYLEPPIGHEEGHLADHATILLVGTDESGLNTDTLMLLNVDREAGQISIMSIPRDTKVNSTYTPHKINGAYAANGKGKEGMFWLCDYVRQCVGFRPDGYILVDLDCFIELVDLFGGVEFNVPMDMDYEDPSQGLYIHLQKGMQTLNGEQAMGVIRFRSGYPTQDLQRVSVQRDFFMAALSQWKSFGNIFKLSSALSILEEYCITDMSTSNLLWIAESFVRCGTDDMMMTTIPYTLGSTYVYIKGDQDYLDLLNEYFNPYEDPIGFEDLNLAS